MFRQADKQTDLCQQSQAEQPTHREMNRQTNRERGRQTDGQTGQLNEK